MKPGIYNMEIEQGATYTKTWTVQSGNLDLSVYDGIRMKIRRSPGKTVIWDSTQGGGSLAINGNDKIELVIDAATTAEFDFSEAMFDMELYITASPERVFRLIKGKVILNKEVTY